MGFKRSLVRIQSARSLLIKTLLYGGHPVQWMCRSRGAQRTLAVRSDIGGPCRCRYPVGVSVEVLNSKNETAPRPDRADRADRVVTNDSTPDAKIELFLSLFRGRPDVYPLRFESRTTGRTGYAPACANEWIRGVCEKPRIKCADCPNRRFLPVTADVVRWHLSGRDDRAQSFVMGVYPMLLDETCHFRSEEHTSELQ